MYHINIVIGAETKYIHFINLSFYSSIHVIFVPVIFAIHVAVENIGDRCCHLPDEDIHVALDSGHIASSVLQDTTCGHNVCPLVIQVESGQQINISTYNFNISSTGMYNLNMIVEHIKRLTVCNYKLISYIPSFTYYRNNRLCLCCSH